MKLYKNKNYMCHIKIWGGGGGNKTYINKPVSAIPVTSIAGSFQGRWENVAEVIIQQGDSGRPDVRCSNLCWTVTHFKDFLNETLKIMEGGKCATMAKKRRCSYNKDWETTYPRVKFMQGRAVCQSCFSTAH